MLAGPKIPLYILADYFSLTELLARGNEKRERMPLPNLIVAGAQKAGTTWLHRVLAGHPQVFMSATKELEFFSKPAAKRRDLTTYEENFGGANDARVVGESTPSYFWSKHHHSRWLEGINIRRRQHNIAQTARETLGPEVNIVILLRDPVERAVSAYVHHLNKGRVSLDEDIISVGARHGIIHMGFYSHHLEPWYDAFGPARVHVQLFERLMGEKEQELRRLLEFLGVDPELLPKPLQGRVNPGSPRRRTRKGIFVTPRHGVEYLAIPAEHLGHLREIYAEDVERLGKMLPLEPKRYWSNFRSSRWGRV